MVSDVAHHHARDASENGQPAAKPTTGTRRPGPPAPAPAAPRSSDTGKVQGDRRRRQRAHRPGHALGGRAAARSSTRTQRTLVLTENPVLHDGPNEVAGERVIVYLDEDRSVVEGGQQAREGRPLSRREDGDGSSRREARRPPRAAPAKATPVNGAGAALLRAERPHQVVRRPPRGERRLRSRSAPARSSGCSARTAPARRPRFYMIVGLARPDAGAVAPERRGRHRAADVRARAARASATCRRSRRSSASSRSSRTSSPSWRRSTSTPRSGRERLRALLDELGIARLAKSKAHVAVGWRAAAPRDHPRAGDLAVVHAARRAVRGHRPDRRG